MDVWAWGCLVFELLFGAPPIPFAIDMTEHMQRDGMKLEGLDDAVYRHMYTPYTFLPHKYRKALR